MKNFTKRILWTVILITIIYCTVKGQTNVSGGIYANTTWTLANSPYIVTDTVVVFPGVTLTIEPGVVVKFDSNIRMEIRQATLIAQGTAADSITFTSSAGSPTPGIWSEIYLNNCTVSTNFNFCKILFSRWGIYGGNYFHLKNTRFSYNNYSGIRASLLSIDSCTFNNNEYGIDCWQIYLNHCFFNNNYIGVMTSDSVHISNCYFTNNITGLYNNYNEIGLLDIHSSTFTNNNTAILNYYIDYMMGGLVLINNCNISNNQTGFTEDDSFHQHLYSRNIVISNCILDSNSLYALQTNGKIINNEIKYNGTGIYDYGLKIVKMNVIDNNNIGLLLRYVNSYDSIFCNRMCNNISYDLSDSVVGGSNLNLSNNYWCTPDSAIISSHIYDGYDNVNLSLIHFMPIDTSQCYLTGCALSVSATVTNSICDTCHNGSATAHAAYGFPPYTYTWYTSPIQTNQTATGLAPGTYHLCVTDAHGCTACDSNIVVDTTSCNGFSAQVNATTASCNTCNDGSATLQITGGSAPFQYVWNTVPPQHSSTASGLFPGIYSVCITDNNACIICDTFQVFSFGNCLAYFHLYPDTATPHHYFAMNMATGVPPIAWYWNWGDGTHDTTAYPNHTYSIAGFYTICLTITDGGGCINTYCDSFYLQKNTNTMITVNVISNTITGINIYSNDNSFYIFPNPAINNITLAVKQKATIEISNIEGQLLKTLSTSGNKINIDVSALPCGVYVVEVKTEKGVAVKKFIKE